MTHKLTVRFGGAADSEVHDYSSQVRLYNSDGSRSIHGGMRCDNGSASSGEFELLDEQNLIPHGDADGLQIAAHNQVIWSEDSPGYEAWLSIGRVSPKNVERPYDRTAGVARTWVTEFDDANMDIDGITLTTDEARPAETDVDRILWALGAFCDGDPRLTTVFATDLVSTAGAVTMPAKTYEAGTELDEIFQDCASTAGKIYAVVIHEDDDEAGDHTCFLYIDEEDHTTYACTLSISDQLADVDGETVFEPHWRQGAATTEDGQDLQTGIVSRYGMDTTATVVVTDTDHADAYDYWVKPYFDDVSETATQATNRATALLHARWNEHLTHTPSILIPARLHNLVRAGMSIGIRSAAAMGGQYLNTTQTRRIAQIEWEPAGRRGDDELLWANLQLDRPRRVLGAGSGTKPGPKPPTQGSAPSIVRSGGAYGLGGALGPVNMVIDGGGDDMIVVFVVTLNTQDVTAVKYTPNVTFPGTTESFTQIGSDVTVGTDPIPRVTAWKLYEPSASTGSGRISLTLNGTNAPGAMFVRYIAGVTNTTPSSQSGSTVGTSVSTTLAGVGTGHLVLDGLGWGATHTAALTAAEGADQTEDYQDGTAGQSGIPDAVLASSHQLGSAGGVMSWSSIPASANYTGAAHLVVGVLGVDGDSPPPAADDGTGDIGTGDGCYATCDHKHPAQTAAVTPFTPDGSIAATNVQAAIVEVRDEVPALSNATPLVESGSGSAGTASSVSRSDHVHPADGGGGGGGGSSPSPVQEKASGQAQNVSSYSLVLPSVPSNSMLLAWACEDATTQVSSITQAGVTWTRLNRTVVNGFGHELWIGTGTATTATVSVTMSASQWSHCAVVELSGLTGTLDNTQSGSGRAVMLRSTATTTVWVAQARNSGGGGFASVITAGAPNLFPIMQDRNGAIWFILAPATERNVVVMPGADGTAQTAILWAVD